VSPKLLSVCARVWPVCQHFLPHFRPHFGPQFGHILGQIPPNWIGSKRQNWKRNGENLNELDKLSCFLQLRPSGAPKLRARQLPQRRPLGLAARPLNCKSRALTTGCRRLVTVVKRQASAKRAPCQDVWARVSLQLAAEKLAARPKEQLKGGKAQREAQRGAQLGGESGSNSQLLASSQLPASSF